MPECVQRESEQQREAENLQDIDAREGVDRARRNDGQEELADTARRPAARVLGDRPRIQRRRVDVHADAGLYHVDDDQADEERQRGDDFEVENRQQPRASDRLDVAHAGDAADHGAEDHRAGDHPYQLDEAVAERLQGGAGVGGEVSQQHAGHRGQQHLPVQGR